MIKTLNYLITFCIAAILINSNISAQLSITNSTVYQCPMKCEGEKTYDKPGKCPVCGMNLKEVKKKINSGGNKSNTKIIGAMMNIMQKGELFGTIDLDTISDKKHLYGLGPVEYLKGEILIVDGKCFISKVSSRGSIRMKETYKTKAPFFVYENVERWNEISLPDSVCTIPQLESFLDQTTKDHSRPFAFKLTATVDSGDIHIVNLPKGTAVHSPEDVFKYQKQYDLKNEKVTLVGFFSTSHQGIFTHHDTYVHIHLITSDEKKMGHLDKLNLQKGTVKLFIPVN